MHTRRSIISRSLAGYVVAVCVVSLSTSLAQVEGRKCVCTNKACKEAGVEICRTKFFCYTELILTSQEIGESTTTRGCTEVARPLLCETKSWITGSRLVNSVEPSTSSQVLVPWPRLKCCDSHDYCNADSDEENTSTWTRERKPQMDQARSTVDRETPGNPASTSRDAIQTMQPDRKSEDQAESADRLLRNRVRALHVAALILAFAALISVLASCYVVTRFLRSNRYTMGAVSY
nr:PREDICTED: uncharacterized protein LOC105672865 [Linepithema humile]XP_012223501.1 PREDICTED: uncharacterized protein LOC105672865 [Linepithema humile]XP_012223511.1 PREDICTED: uncharacterized protein LOC105672865 [Linepithema humile]XP_012223521.1 PREDICTED: uncharacterized protein LOC105672865 [Linepithema humile]XP_012223531.1 PREDICTED: uncharacterized protein LOC105672865 [Linepithema humile]XP_012223540.1 PREDICTED: uncharacterized protein LOC105672865 [Linepithema humile]